MDPKAILKEPYARVLVPEADGSFTAEILEFPGCVASGATPAEALECLEEVAADWLSATVEQGQSIPPPVDNSSFSGKLVLRMSKGLHKRATRAAARDGVSLNQFIVTCLAEHVGERDASRRHHQQQLIQNFFVNAMYASTGAGERVAPLPVLNRLSANPWGKNAGH